MPLRSEFVQWDSQPQEAVQIAAQFAHAAFLHLPSVRGELARNARLTTNPPNLSPAAAGLGYTAVGGLASRAATNNALTTSNGVGTGDFTLLVYAAPTASATRQMPIALSNAVGGNGESYIIFNAGSNLAASSGKLTFTIFSAQTGLESAGAVDGKAHVFAVRRIGSALSLWRDGVLLSSVTYTTTVVPNNNDFTYIGGYKDAGYGHVDPLYLAAGWNAALSDQQIRHLADPWQLFEPRRLVIPSAPAAGGAYTLTAAAGSYSLSGQAATITRSRALAAAAGSYATTGQAATIKRNKALAAAAGSYSVTGQAATLAKTAGATNYTLTAAAGSYSLSGQAAIIKRSRALAAAAGSYSIAGQAATIARSRVLPASAGSYAISGQAATFKRNRVVAAAAGVYAITGKPAAIAYSGAVAVPSSIRFDISTGRLVKIINSSICITL